MAESTMVTGQINTLKTLFSQLTMLGHNIEENERAELLLQSLPDSYDQLIINLTNNNPVDNLVFDDVAVSILNEESRRKNKKNRQVNSQQAEALSLTRGRSEERGPSGSQNHGRSKSRSKKNVKCYNCGATWHMTSRREWFHIYKPISGGSVYMGDDHALEIAGIDGEFLTFCKQEGIQRQFTVAYTPQQNRVAERMTRTLKERIRAMLRAAGLPNSFWAEAAKTACYIVNRSPSTVIGLRTAMEIWTGKPANYSYLHVFGCLMYVMYNAQERTKLDAKSRRCIFLGYADGVKGKVRDCAGIVENNPEDSDSSEAAPEHEEQEPIESEAPEARRSTRERRPPTWHSEYVTEINVAYCLLTEDGEPSTFHEPLNSSDFKRDGNDQMERYRARLVVKGYAQKEGNDFNEIFSPVVRLTTVRVVLAMCATFDLHLEQLDVKTAFLHGELEEEIYMLQPEGFAETGKENLVCRLNKSLYGLKQAPRCWYKRFDSFIMSLEYNRLSSDHCIYYKRFEDNDFIILLLYVDDMLVAGPNKDRIQELNAQLAREFEMKDLGPVNKILGIQIHRDRNNRKIWLSQKNYLKKILQRFNIEEGDVLSTVCISSGKFDVRYDMYKTRHCTSSGSKFTVRGYVDSDFAGDLDKRKSIIGYVFTLAGAAISWVSKLQTVVALSTTEAEYMAVTQACKEAIWIQRLLEELGHKQQKIPVFCDSQSALHIARNPAFHSRTKHIGVQYHFV
ncbi:hypothetical protein KPL70_017783 [Citrus sinensis]|nr:hypothetical protein KPL70_017783 [Citrus sinensis]